MNHNEFLQDEELVRQQGNILTVSGEGVIEAHPDIAVVTLGASTEDTQANVAQSNNAQIITTIIQSLQNLSLSPDDMKTIDYRINVQHDYVDGKQVFRGYEVVHLLEVTIKQIEQTGIIIDVAVNNGANIVTNLQFTTAHPDVYYNEALALALNNAQKKARVVADTLMVSLNETPVKIIETSHAAPPNPFQVATFAKSAETPVMTGQVQIKASINAQFVYES